MLAIIAVIYLMGTITHYQKIDSPHGEYKRIADFEDEIRLEYSYDAVHWYVATKQVKTTKELVVYVGGDLA